MNDWKQLVAYFRQELNRYFPECPMCDIGVSGELAGPYTLTMSPDDGVTIVEWNQVYEHVAYYTFKQKNSRRVITIPFMRD